ncbi:molybdopterin dinucleotide binding domain-containing protein [Streptomyces sp. NPDC056227]|uniref:molybdopterin dinucleotide binding domain-containing protein n=1 Tax=Streptomyces sp. NPDC056227 TaxID=3345753 RepID=UPI0035DC6C89
MSAGAGLADAASCNRLHDEGMVPVGRADRFDAFRALAGRRGRPGDRLFESLAEVRAGTADGSEAWFPAVAGIDVPEAASLLAVARAAGIELPALCSDDRLSPNGPCRTCLVRAGGQIVAACVTPAASGDRVETSTDELRRLRRDAVELIVSALPSHALANDNPSDRAAPGGQYRRDRCPRLDLRRPGYDSGSTTRRGGNLALDPADFLGLHPDDAIQYGLRDGTPVGVESRHGRARVSVQTAADQVFCSFHFPASGVNRLTSHHTDTVTSCPEYKVTPVRLAAL